MKELFLITFFAFVFGLSVNAQSNDLTWNELKTVQESERRELYARQDSERKTLLQVQVATLERGFGNGLNANDVSKLHAEERDRLSKLHSEERKAMTAEHAAERTAFNQKSRNRTASP